jgi:hypothetical protein
LYSIFQVMPYSLLLNFKLYDTGFPESVNFKMSLVAHLEIETSSNLVYMKFGCSTCKVTASVGMRVINYVDNIKKLKHTFPLPMGMCVIRSVRLQYKF